MDLGEVGTYLLEEGVYILTSNRGLTRRLERQLDGRLRVVAQGDLSEKIETHSLLDWDLRHDSRHRPLQ